MSGTDSGRVIYWDTCIYLAWLKEEEGAYGRECIDAIRQLAKENVALKATIITSTLTYVEVLSATLSDDQERQFRGSLRSSNHFARDVDPPVAMKARDFRHRLLNHPSGKTLATPDAVHLATASIFKAEFWTLDDGGSDRRHLGLLGLNGDERVDYLKICKPWASEPELGISA